MKLTAQELRKRLQQFEIQTVSTLIVRLARPPRPTLSPWTFSMWSVRIDLEKGIIFICIPVHRNLGDVVC